MCLYVCRFIEKKNAFLAKFKICPIQLNFGGCRCRHRRYIKLGINKRFFLNVTEEKKRIKNKLEKNRKQVFQAIERIKYKTKRNL